MYILFLQTYLVWPLIKRFWVLRNLTMTSIYLPTCIYIEKGIVKLGNRCALKLEKAIEVSCTGFFSCYLSPKVPNGKNCIKTQASKFNPGVKMRKKSQRNDYLLKELFVVHFFSIIVHYFFGFTRSTKCVQ